MPQAKQKRKRKPTAKILKPESAKLNTLKPHPRNYRVHTEEQLSHIVKSMTQHGVYRNVVVANEWTILAGHGMVLAAKILGKRAIPVIRVPYGPNDPRSLKILTGDNEIARLAGVNDRELTELLKEISESDGGNGLDGTGFDKTQLAALAMVTRPASEIQTMDAAAEWMGMPAFEHDSELSKLTIFLPTLKARKKLAKLIEQELPLERKSCWYPEKEERTDLRSVAFVADDEAEAS